MTGHAEVSHGRGGAGNITPDNTQYVDGEIVRQGEVGSQGTGAFSTGRGGGGNIGDAHAPPGPRKDEDVVPEAAMRRPSEDDYHVGRGGAANVHLGPEHQSHKIADGHPTTGTQTSNVGLADKLKDKIFGVFSKK